MQKIKNNVRNQDVIDASLKCFKVATDFLNFSQLAMSDLKSS